MNRRKLAERVVKILLPGAYVVGPAYEPVVEQTSLTFGTYVDCGSGPEYATSYTHVNPNWLRNRAANFMRIADYIEEKQR